MNPDDRIRLKVLGLSFSQLQINAYALILAQADGPYRIPVVIGPAEAQSIAVSMEQVTPPRPMTHDLFMSFSHAFGIKLTEVFIYKFEDGIFYSEMTFTDGERTIVTDARTSDAVAIALRSQTPIYTTRAILDETGFLMDEEEDKRHKESAEETVMESETPYEPSGSPEPKIENYTIEELERTLSKLISQENYEEAAKVSEILNRKKREKGGGQ